MPYQQKKRQESHDHLNRCKKVFDKIQHPFVIKKLLPKWVQKERISYNESMPIEINLQQRRQEHPMGNNGGKTVSSASGVGAAGQLHVNQ